MPSFTQCFLFLLVQFSPLPLPHFSGLLLIIRTRAMEVIQTECMPCMYGALGWISDTVHKRYNHNSRHSTGSG